MDSIFAICVMWCMILGIFIVPFGMLANNAYRAVYKAKPSTGVWLLNFIPFYNYIVIRKYLYGKALIPSIMCILTFLCFGFRALAMFMWATTNPWMMLISVYASIAGLCLWYLTMAFTSCYCAILTRRGIVTIILGTIIPFFGAFIVAKNIRAYFAQTLEVNSEFTVNN